MRFLVLSFELFKPTDSILLVLIVDLNLRACYPVYHVLVVFLPDSG